MSLSLLQLSLIAVIVIQLTSSVDGEKIRREICSLSQQNLKNIIICNYCRPTMQ